MMSTGYPRLKRNISNKNSWIQITNTELEVRLGAAKSYEKKVETVMVNNSTNINKTNNHLSPQIIEHMVFEIRILAWHRHTKMWQPPLASNHRTQKGQQNMGLEIQVLAWDRHKSVVRLNQLMESQPSSDN